MIRNFKWDPAKGELVIEDNCARCKGTGVVLRPEYDGLRGMSDDGRTMSCPEGCRPPKQ